MITIYDQIADMFLNSATGQRSGLTHAEIVAQTRARWPTESEARAALDDIGNKVKEVVETAQVLRDAGVTYRVVEQGRAIQCLTCGMTSWHAEDVRQRYCAKCDVFHDDVKIQ